MNSILSLALAYVLGYILNAISGLVEPFYFWTMGGRPSDKLLTTPPKNCSSGKIKEYTGYGRIKFFHYDKVIKMLKDELEDSNACTRKMFGKAMSYSNSHTATRVPDFNAYAFSRVMLTLALVVGIILAFYYYCQWWYWLVFVVTILLLWNRCKERGYYYAKEVLVEYIKIKESKLNN
ncbi:MAG: hypothetical protein IKN48_11360 [Bacteroidaceae bacterium]|nr:hypothetical protein [Bacteroidaceae bacterium]